MCDGSGDRPWLSAIIDGVKCIAKGDGPVGSIGMSRKMSVSPLGVLVLAFGVEETPPTTPTPDERRPRWECNCNELVIGELTPTGLLPGSTN